MNCVLSSVYSICLTIMEAWAAATVGDSTKKVGWGEVDPTPSAHKANKNHQLGRAESRGGTAGAGSGCLLAVGMQVFTCMSATQTEHTLPFAAKRSGETLRGERRHCDGDSNLGKVKRLRVLQGHRGSGEEGTV